MYDFILIYVTEVNIKRFACTQIFRPSQKNFSRISSYLLCDFFAFQPTVLPMVVHIMEGPGGGVGAEDNAAASAASLGHLEDSSTTSSRSSTWPYEATSASSAASLPPPPASPPPPPLHLNSHHTGSAITDLYKV